MLLQHPGELVNKLILEPSGISQSELSRRLGFNQPQPVNELVKGKRGFTPKMALLFERVTNGDYPAAFWLMAQALYDVEVAREAVSPSRRTAVDALSCSLSVSQNSREAECHNLLKFARQAAQTTTA